MSRMILSLFPFGLLRASRQVLWMIVNLDFTSDVGIYV